MMTPSYESHRDRYFGEPYLPQLDASRSLPATPVYRGSTTESQEKAAPPAVGR